MNKSARTHAELDLTDQAAGGWAVKSRARFGQGD